MTSSPSDKSEFDLLLEIKLTVAWLISQEGFAASLPELRKTQWKLKCLTQELNLVHFLNSRPRSLENVLSRSWHQ